MAAYKTPSLAVAEEVFKPFPQLNSGLDSNRDRVEDVADARANDSQRYYD
jgi:hypothetical protein